MEDTVERTLFFFKPRAISSGRWMHALGFITVTGLRIIGIKMIVDPSQREIEALYAEHRGRDYFPWLCKQLIGQPIVALVIDGERAIERVRRILGPTEPEKAPKYSIRGYFKTDNFARSREQQRAVDNTAHASSDAEMAEREISIWFSPDELLPQRPSSKSAVRA